MKKKKPALRSSPAATHSSSSSLSSSLRRSQANNNLAYDSDKSTKKWSNFVSLIWKRGKLWQWLLLFFSVAVFLWILWMTALRILSHFFGASKHGVQLSSQHPWRTATVRAPLKSSQRNSKAEMSSLFGSLFGSSGISESDKSVSEGGSSSLRFIAISDTHNGHERLTDTLKQLYQSPSDVLIHCGDMTNRGTEEELKSINEWFGTLPFKRIVVVSGNMDGLGLDQGGLDGHKLFTNAVYLEDESLDLDGLHLYGSPFTPKFVGGFQLKDESHSRLQWSKIPQDTDVLITHGPPRGILDRSSSGFQVGDEQLLSAIAQRPSITLNVFGHVHESHGTLTRSLGSLTKKHTVQFLNAAVYNAIYKRRPGVSPLVFTLPLPSTKQELTSAKDSSVDSKKRLSDVL